MIALIRYLYFRLVRVYLVGVILFCVTDFVLKTLDYSAKPLHVFAVIAAIASVVSGPTLATGYSSWMMMIPIARRRLPIVLLAVNLANAATVMLLSAFYIAFISKLANGDFRELAKFLEFWKTNWIEFLRSPLALKNIVFTFGVINFGLMTNFFAFSFMYRQQSLGPRGMNRSVSFIRPVSRSYRVKSILAILSALALFQYALRPVGIAILVVTSVPLTIFLASTGLAVFGKARRRWVYFGIVLAFAEAIFLGNLLRRDFTSKDRIIEAEIYNFLGIEEQLGESKIIEILTGDFDARYIRRMGHLFRQRFNAGKEVLGSDMRLEFSKVVQSKNDAYALTEALAIYDVKSLGAEQIRIYFAQVAKCGCENSQIYRLIPADLTTEETRQMIKSENPLLAEYGLIRARFYRDPSYSGAILSGLDSYPDAVRLAAFKSLEILSLQDFGIDQYFQIRTNPIKTEYPFANIDCAAMSKKELSEVLPEDSRVLTACLYEWSLPKAQYLVARAETKGWIKTPLNEQDRERVRQLKP
jgi:hypothetical protein